MTEKADPPILGELPVAPPSPVGKTETTTRQIDEASALRESQAAILRTAGQRQINVIWEITQATIALSVVGVTLYVNAAIATSGVTITEGQSSALMQLNVTGALVIGFYFGRTNHQRVGGIGADASQTRAVLPLLLAGGGAWSLYVLTLGYPLLWPMVVCVYGAVLIAAIYARLLRGLAAGR